MNTPNWDDSNYFTDLPNIDPHQLILVNVRLYLHYKPTARVLLSCTLQVYNIFFLRFTRQICVLITSSLTPTFIHAATIVSWYLTIVL